MGHIGNLHIIEYLHVCLRHLHADIVLRFLEIGGSSLEVQLVELDLIGNLEAREDGHAGAERETRRRGIRVRVSIISRQTASEAEVLPYASAQIRQAGILRRRELNLLLAALVLLLLDADIIRHSVVAALAQAPLALLSSGGEREGGNEGCCDTAAYNNVLHKALIFSVFVGDDLGAAHLILGADALLDFDVHTVGEARLHIRAIVGLAFALALDDVDEG